MNEQKIDYIRSKRFPFSVADIVILLLAVVLTVILSLTVAGKKGYSVEVVCDGSRTVLSLSENSELSVNGVVVAVSGGKCRVSQSNCKNQTCVKSRAISKVGESIVCAQNGVVVTVIGFDGLAGTVGRG